MCHILLLSQRRQTSAWPAGVASRPSSPKHRVDCFLLWELTRDCLWLQLHLPPGLWPARGTLSPTQLIEQCCTFKLSSTQPIRQHDMRTLIKAFAMGPPSFPAQRMKKRDYLDLRTAARAESLTSGAWRSQGTDEVSY